MNNVNIIHHNDFGITFRWKESNPTGIQKIQLVFRHTGLLLSRKELILFLKNIQHTKQNSSLCKDCANNESCRALLVDSPTPQVSFSMNINELESIENLIEGTLFQLNLDDCLDGIIGS